jgi:transcriptional regulator of acetoin/glycerol metabolism
MRRARERSHGLTRAARPVLDALGKALANTRYFAILTDAQGVVVEVDGPIDRSDRRADLITRIGTDLSEACVGTTAIGAALSELQPVWLHRGEHFFGDTSSYSCAGAPLFGPRGEVVGMLDLTGVDTPERPELKHLAVQSARSIENALALRQQHRLLLRLNWPGHRLGDDSDGLIGLDTDGRVSTSNSAARAMLPALATAGTGPAEPPHASELFALPVDQLFDAAGHRDGPISLPLWSGLQLHALVTHGADTPDALAGLRAGIPGSTTQGDPRRLRDIETAWIRKAVDEARGNVALAATRLGVSRATVYRKLGMPRA